MEDTVAAAQENAQAVRLALREMALALLFELRLAPIVVFDGRERCIQRDVEVVIEIATNTMESSSPCVS